MQAALACLYLLIWLASSNKWSKGSTGRGNSNGPTVSGIKLDVVQIINRTTSHFSTPSGLDPIQNLCERFYHQSTIKNNTLYLYAGVETYAAANNNGQPEGPITIGTNNLIIAVNMNVSWDWSHLSQKLLSPAKSPSPGNAYAPVVIRGALFAGGPADNNIYMFGGTTSGLNTSFVGFQPLISTQNWLWSYDTIKNQWDQHDLTPATPQRLSAGAAAEVPDQNLAFYLGGTSTATSDLGSDLMSVEGLVIIDTAKRTSRNVSTKSIGSEPRAGGVLQYISGIGTKGVLVAVGGSYRSPLAIATDEIGTLLPMDKINIFNIASIYDGGKGTWYTQQATGDIPPGRVEFCSVMATAPDNSSHNIYVYGGRASSTIIFDDVYILSIPSFIWTLAYRASDPKPRYGHTCHLVARRQMVTVGGSRSTSFNSCDWETKGVGIFDMTSLIWGDSFDYDAPDYGVPTWVTMNIGGSSYGSANITKPASGFTDPSLAALFAEEILPVNSTYQTPQTGSAKKKLTYILPPIIGCLLLLTIFIIWRIRSHRSPHQSRNPPLLSESSDVEMGRMAPRSPSLQNAPYDPRNPVGND